MITIRAFNVEYDTVDCDGIERRSQINPRDIPYEVVFDVDEDTFPHRQLDRENFVLKRIEQDWLVDRFDYEVIQPRRSKPHHVECQCREAYGVPLHVTLRREYQEAAERLSSDLRSLDGIPIAERSSWVRERFALHFGLSIGR